MKATVNPWYLHVLMDPLAGLADNDDAVLKYRSLDPNSEVAVRLVIRELICPYLTGINALCLSRVKLAMRYFSATPNFPWDRLYESDLPPFDPPDDPRDFFVWVWNECFPGESIAIDNLDDYEVVRDLDEVNRTLAGGT